jgi:hypothetical protein
MNNTTESFQAYVQVFFQLHPQQRKFESGENIFYIIERMRSYGLSTPSDTMVYRALSELLSEGAITRVDGGDEHTDQLAAERAKQDQINRLVSQPLTIADFDKFARMSPAEVERAFNSDRVFAARYTRAAQKWGFKIPAPIAGESVESDLGEWKNLDARTYHSIPASKIVQLYRSSKTFKRATDKLISEGRI